ncbi:MAG: hypothetical protein JWP44_4100 [Mucilaginibacter sp.]|nr:hypothetical protein [Mucilaginibacter sp.]
MSLRGTKQSHAIQGNSAKRFCKVCDCRAAFAMTISKNPHHHVIARHKAIACYTGQLGKTVLQSLRLPRCVRYDNK